MRSPSGRRPPALADTEGWVLSCRDITEQASDYLEKTTPWRGRALFRIHLGMCRHCRELVRQLELTTAVLRSGVVDPVPAGITEPGDDVLSTFRSEFGNGGGDDSGVE